MLVNLISIEKKCQRKVKRGIKNKREKEKVKYAIKIKNNNIFTKKIILYYVAGECISLLNINLGMTF